MSFAAWLGISINFLSGAIAFGLGIVLLWQNSRHRQNLLLASFLIAFGMHVSAANTARLAPELELNLKDALRVSGTMYVVSVSLLLLFNVEFIGLTHNIRNLARVLLISLGIGGVLYMSSPNSGYNNIYTIEKGIAGYDPTPLTAILIAFTSVLMLLDAVLLWYSPKVGSRELAYTMMIIPLGFVGVFFENFPVPTLSLVMIVIGMLAARLVLRLQVFDPLTQTNENLKNSNDQLTNALQELAKINVELAETSRMQLAFLANMSHELRTPIHAIMGFTELIQDGTYGEVNLAQAQRLNRIVDSSKNLLRLINDLLDLSKITAGQMKIMQDSLKPQFILDGVVDSMKPLLDSKQLTFHRDYKIAPPIYADELRFRQIIVNLLGNAIKFTESGEIHLNITINEDGMVQFSITDTGIGIPSDQLHKVFDEFQQVERDTAQEHQGTGLGLAIVKKLVELHGGTVAVESTIGEGSTFTFTMPQPPLESTSIPSTETSS